MDAISWVLDAAAQMNRTEVAKELSVSRDTIKRYKNRLAEMNRQERILLTSALGRKQLLKEATR